jgi:hypothetical protein
MSDYLAETSTRSPMSTTNIDGSSNLPKLPTTIIDYCEWIKMTKGKIVEFGIGYENVERIIRQVRFDIEIMKSCGHTEKNNKMRELINTLDNLIITNNSCTLFVHMSCSTVSEMHNRAIFVVDYIKMYPSWIKAVKFEDDECWLGMKINIFDKLYKEFMSYQMKSSEKYKNIFESLIEKYGGVSVSEAKYYPFNVSNDNFRYGSIDIKLQNNGKMNFCDYLFFGFDSTQIMFYQSRMKCFRDSIEMNEITKDITIVKKFVNMFIENPNNDYGQIPVSIEKCKIKEKSVELLVIEIVYDLLCIRKVCKILDRTIQSNTYIRMVRAYIIMHKIRKYIRKTFR